MPLTASSSTPIGLTSLTVEEAFKVPEDPRLVARREKHQAEMAKQREAKRQADDQARDEWEANAAERKAYSRFKTANDNCTAERIRPARAFETTITMPQELAFANPTTW